MEISQEKLEIYRSLYGIYKDLNDKVNYVYHRSIFKEYSDYLPTFNSIAIETMLWRIEGLSEHFLYFNDDVFLARPLKNKDFFYDGKTIIRGRWMDCNSLLQNQELAKDPAKFNHFMQLNSARILGFKPNQIFKTAHVVHAFKRSTMKRLFLDYRLYFSRNVKFRFRDLKKKYKLCIHFDWSNNLIKKKN